MSESDGHKQQSLTVLPSSGRVEQLRREMAAENASTTSPATGAESTTPSETFRSAIDPANSPLTSANLTPELKALEGQVIAAVRQVFDPEIPVNIYELGLIYAIEVTPEKVVNVRMTLTTPACPVAGSLPGEIQRRIEAIDEVTSANIDLVWDPPWDRSMMSEAAMLQLGMF